MKNVVDIVKGLGLELTDEQAAALTSETAKNYKTVAEFDKKVKGLEDEKNSIQTQLNTATETLKGFEGVDVAEINKKLSEANKTIENMRNEYQKKQEETEFASLLEKAVEGVKFTSASARKAFMQDVKGVGLKAVNGKIIGFNDYLAEYKKADPDAIDDGKTPPAKFTEQPDQGQDKPALTKEDIMKISDTRDRQKAIAENLKLFTK